MSNLLLAYAGYCTVQSVVAPDLFTEIKTDMPEFPGNLNKTELHAAVTVKEELNKVLTTVREKIEQRKRNIYKPLKTPFTDKMDEAYSNVRTAWKTCLFL